MGLADLARPGVMSTDATGDREGSDAILRCELERVIKDFSTEICEEQGFA